MGSIEASPVTSLVEATPKCAVCNNFEARVPGAAFLRFRKLATLSQTTASAGSGCVSRALIVRVAQRSGRPLWKDCEDSEKIIQVVCDFHDPNHDSVFITLHRPMHLAHHEKLKTNELRLELYTHQSE
jgi:hypothetical protein